MNFRFLLLIGLIALFTVGVYAQDARLNINEQPLPQLPKNHGTLDLQGTVVLRIQFLDTGEIGEVSAAESLPSGLTEMAIDAARRIKFEPERKNGKPVTVIRVIQYLYSWNGGWRIPVEKTPAPVNAEPGKAEEIIKKAVATLGGDRYLQIKSQVGRGKFSSMREGQVVLFQSFVDVIVFPDRERTEFRGNDSRTTQTNTGSTGWIYDGDQELIKIQNAGQIANFKKAIRTSLDNLLRGYWKGDGSLTYVGKRAATLGRRNDVVRLTYTDGFVVEFEFASDDGLPQKALYITTDNDGAETKEEDRYAQFIEVGGVKTPFIIDRFFDGKQSSRINYETVEFNKSIPDSVFAKPASPKDAKKDLKLP